MDYDAVPHNDGFDGELCDTEIGFMGNCLGWGGFCILIAIALLSNLAGAVPPLTVAIKYNSFNKAADTSTIYRPGRHFLKPMMSFLYFPSDVRNIEFSSGKLQENGVRYPALHTRTKEGLGLHLQVALQYQLMPDKVGQLYDEFNQAYEDVFISAVRDILIKAASEYEARQFWQERELFGNKMQSMVDKVLRRMYARCWGLQLLMIDLPDAYEESIVTTQVQGQSKLMSQQQQMVSRIQAETGVIEADYDRQVKIILAQGKGNYTLTTQKAAAHAQQRVVTIQTEMITVVKTSLGLDGAGLVAYQRYDAVDELGDASVFFGFGGAPQVLVNSGGL